MKLKGAAVKITGRLKKREIRVKLSSFKEACKVERFNMLIATIEKKLKLKKKKVMLIEKKVEKQLL